MTASMPPETPVNDQDDAENEGVSATEPAEGADDAPAGDDGSPEQ
ncbi:hypothetical protein SAMN06297144_2795 [Sphingomonas guangdongensis]|uniref:Uncharacterized protein n=1 Tax=Sphingomonas guangdongensis TaxID=1141890 RepID=A0A285R1R9_9SPHN|nr:hypothetical protein [Sphingomonas guangdongensis]SOB87659.1 hypothetical protein SAMN06297144_2795 [Sphingomonas guangdongensis]